MDPDDAVAATRRYQYLDFDPVDAEVTKVEVVDDTDDPPSSQVGYSSLIDDPSLITVSHRRDAPVPLRPTQPIRRRVTRPMGRAPRRACNTHTPGSRRVRAGPSSDDDSPHEDGESDGSFSRPLSLGVG